MQSLVVVVMDYGLAAIAIRIFLFDHGGSVTWLPFFDDGGTVTVAVMITRLANRHTSSDRTHANTNIIGKDGCRNSANYGGDKK